jgi:hypothetical protein
MSKKKETKMSYTQKQLIKKEYEEGVLDDKGILKWPSIAELAIQHNVAQSTLYRLSNDDQWKFRRSKFQQKIQEQRQEQIVNTFAEEGAKLDSTALNLSKALMATVAAALRENQENYNARNKTLVPTQMNALANTALTAQRLGKLALGESTHNVEINTTDQQHAFRKAMELLDELESSKRDSGIPSTH